jgi:hypothetical protein
MNMEKKICLIPSGGEYRLKRLVNLVRICESIGSDFGNDSRAKRATLAGMRWRICGGK